VLVGWVAFWPAAIVVAVSAVAALSLAVLWLRDLDRLTQVLRQIARAEVPAGDTPARSVFMEPIARELDRLARRLAAVAEQEAQARRADTLILERLPDPVIVVAADRTLRRSNAAARAAFGTDIGAVLRHPSLRGAIDRAVSQSEPQTAELSLRAPLSREVNAAAVPMDPVLADGGRVLVVLSDRTRERMVERMRADFVANVSHELRTPLASVIGFIETLQGAARDDAEAQQRFLEIMAEQGARMNRLIDDLLSLSRIELTEHQAPSDPLDLPRLIERLTAGFEPRLAQRSVTLTREIDDRLPPVAGDADQMAQVLQNLLDNGLKYGREGSMLTLTLRLAAGGEGSDDRWPTRPGVVLAVADQGIGIAKEHLPRLTERFYRVDKGRSRAVGGTGLGLAIVKHIVSRHRGQLSIESTEGVGTTVSVWLPAAPAVARQAEPA